MISPTILAVVIAIFTALSFTGGFVVSNWRSGARIEKLSSENSVLTAANDHCAADVQSVRADIDALTQAAAERVKEAKAEAVKAQPKADKHTSRAIVIKSAPIRTDETLCQAVEREQIEYVTGRRNGD
jgi:outer membrane murein-binding lipoprotein Lpp